MTAALATPSAPREPVSVRFELPLPPSVNHYRPIGRGRPYPSPAFKQWHHVAAALVMVQRIGKVPRGGLIGDIRAELIFARRGDIDNRIKPTLDLLQEMAVIGNDSQIAKLIIDFGPVKGCIVKLEEVGEG